MKKIIIGFGILAAVLLGVLALVPVFYSVDELRPQIKTAVEKSIRGKVELGKLSLRLIPDVALKIDGVKVFAPAPFNKEPLAVTEKVELRLPLYSLLFAPAGTFLVSNTQLKIVANDKTSSLSETLPNPSVEELKAVQTEARKGKPLEDSLKGLPTFIESRIAAARFNFALENLNVEMLSPKASITDRIQVKNFNLKLSDIGIGSRMQLEGDGVVDVRSSGLTVGGPIKVAGTLSYRPAGRDHELSVDLLNDLDSLDIAMNPLFHKTGGVPFGASVAGIVKVGVENTQADFSKLAFRFANVELEGTLKAAVDAIDSTKGEFTANFEADNFDLSAWGSLVPLVRDFKLGGKAGLKLRTAGPLKDPSVDMFVNLTGVTGATPALQKPITNLNGQIRVAGTAANPRLMVNPFSMKIGSGDMSLKVETSGLENISAKISVASDFLDADELLGMGPVVAKKGSKSGQQKSSSSQAAPSQPLDETLNIMAPELEAQLENPMLDKVSAQISTEFKKIKITGAILTNANFNMNYSARKLVINKTGLNAFGGKVLFDMGMDMKNPKALGYMMNAGMTGVDVAQITSVYAPNFKNDISGALTGQFSVSGAGLRKGQLAKNLRGSLKGNFVNGKFSLPLTSLALEAGVDSLKGLAAKGGLVGKAANAAAKEGEKSSGKKHSATSGEFKTARIDAAIEGREIKLRAFEMEFKEANNRPASFKGSGTISFDRALNLLGVATVSEDSKDFDCMRNRAKLLDFPLKLSGTMDAPKPDYGYTAKHVVGMCTKKMGQQATAKAAEKVIDKAAKKLGVKNPKQVKDAKKAVGGALKKFFGR